MYAKPRRCQSVWIAQFVVRRKEMKLVYKHARAKFYMYASLKGFYSIYACTRIH